MTAAVRRWIRRVERCQRCGRHKDRRGRRDRQGIPGTTHPVPRDAVLRVLCSAVDESELDDPRIGALLDEDDHDKLHRLVFKETGDPFFLESMVHTGKTAENTEERKALVRSEE